MGNEIQNEIRDQLSTKLSAAGREDLARFFEFVIGGRDVGRVLESHAFVDRSFVVHLRRMICRAIALESALFTPDATPKEFERFAAMPVSRREIHARSFVEVKVDRGERIPGATFGTHGPERLVVGLPFWSSVTVEASVPIRRRRL